MDNSINHLAILRKGVDAWNQWKNNFDTKIDRIKTNLREAYFKGVEAVSKADAFFVKSEEEFSDIIKANNIDADLKEAFICGAQDEASMNRTEIDEENWIDEILSDILKTNLIKADLQINFSRANLRGLELSGVNLTGAILNKVNLSSANLSGANLRDVNLSNANLSYANISGANLREVNLSKAKLHQSYLCDTDLSDANLSGANLTEADLSESNLMYADLSCANLNNTDFCKANLLYANLSGADLSCTNLSESFLYRAAFVGAIFNLTNFRNSFLVEADFMRTDLSGIDLSGADLTRTQLYGADLSQAELFKTNLFEAHLCRSTLIQSNLSNSNITATNFYGSARDNWIIEDVECDYFYNDPEGKIRIPKKRNFKKGEFEKRYKQLPEFEFIFENGFSPIDAFIIDQVVQAINDQKPQIELRLDSFHSRGQSRAVFTVIHKDYSKEALKLITYEYEKKIISLEGKNEVLQALISSCINKPQQLIQGKNIAIGENTMGDNIQINSKGNIAFGKDNATVNQTNIEDATNNNELLLKEINNLKDELSKITINQINKDAIDFQFETLEYQAKSDNKNALIMNNALESIKTITQGALGSSMGVGLVEIFKRIGMLIL
ncbi:low-complexity protein [Candidatus Magnetomorum sp. HK-1]|nr:low-complexity protein [Candidatus Magnetomorum sp. HK-1]